MASQPAQLAAHLLADFCPSPIAVQSAATGRQSRSRMTLGVHHQSQVEQEVGGAGRSANLGRRASEYQLACLLSISRYILTSRAVVWQRPPPPLASCAACLANLVTRNGSSGCGNGATYRMSFSCLADFGRLVCRRPSCCCLAMSPVEQTMEFLGFWRRRHTNIDARTSSLPVVGLACWRVNVRFVFLVCMCRRRQAHDT